MKDCLVRIIAQNANVRGLACVTTHLVDQACRLHNTTPTASAALGRALTGVALMGAVLKTGQRVALRFEGNGPLKKILVEAESNGAVMGYVRAPNVEVPLRLGKIDVAGALGRSGLLIVTKDLRLKEPYTGMVELHTGEIAEDLAFYLTESEQVPSAVELGVNPERDGGVSAAGGFLIQSFPPHDEDMVDRLIERIDRMAPITELIGSGKSPEELLGSLFEGIPFDILEKRDLMFQCSCSKERVERALVSLGREEIVAMISEQNDVEVKCEFCHTPYRLSRENLQQLMAEM